MSNTMNAFGRSGCIVKNPKWILSLEGYEDNATWGDLSVSGYGVQEVIGWMVMDTFGVGISEAVKRCKEKNYVMVLTHCETGTKTRYSYCDGKLDN